MVVYVSDDVQVNALRCGWCSYCSLVKTSLAVCIQFLFNWHIFPGDYSSVDLVPKDLQRRTFWDC